jgi:formylmethanofuran dehydrogenase subunit E
MITYCKLKDGNWGLRSTEKLRDGDQVQVTKRDGSTKMERVDHKIYESKEFNLYAIDERKFNRYGEIDCDECGEYVQPGTTCWETGMIH